MEAGLTDRRVNLEQLVERLQLLRGQTFDKRFLRAAASYGTSRKTHSLDDLCRGQQCSAFSQRGNDGIHNRSAAVGHRGRLHCRQQRGATILSCRASDAEADHQARNVIATRFFPAGIGCEHSGIGADLVGDIFCIAPGGISPAASTRPGCRITQS